VYYRANTAAATAVQPPSLLPARVRDANAWFFEQHPEPTEPTAPSAFHLPAGPLGHRDIRRF